MLKWKQIAGRWHLTNEDIAICRLNVSLAQQSLEKICPACLDALADARLQWLNLN